jgi:ABC-type thiamin/hydroxymethylpyrimidine transport system permease subunit
MTFQDLTETVSKYAPILGAALPIPGGAAAGNAVAKIAEIFGGNSQDIPGLISKINADPNAQQKLMELQNQETAWIVEMIRTQAADMANARNMRVELVKLGYKDNTVRNLSYMIVGGFWFISTVTLYLVHRGSVTGVEGTLIGTLLGYWLRSVSGVEAFHFGDRTGALTKDELLSRRYEQNG